MADEHRHGVFIVSGIPLLTAAIRVSIESEVDLFVCGESVGVPDALPKIAEANPDLVILDLQLQGGTGLDITKRLKAKDHSRRILLVSLLDESLYADRGLRAGAMGYVNKSSTPADLVTAVRCVLDGRIYLSDAMEQQMLGKFVAGEDAASGPLDDLTDRELEVFQFLSEGYTNREIASKMSVSIKTVDTYRENVKTKLRLKSANELVRYAIEWQIEFGD